MTTSAGDKVLYTETAIIQAVNTGEFRLEDYKGFAVSAIYTVNTPSAVAAAAAAVTAAADSFTIAAHGLTTGLKGQLTTTTTLPAGLALATDYFIVATDATTIKFATSLVNALAGTVVDITDQGVGTHTFTPTAIAGASIKLQASTDGSNWFDISGKSANITATGSSLFEVVDAYYHRVRAVVALTAGRIALDVRLNAKA